MSEAWQPLPMLLMWRRALRIGQRMCREEGSGSSAQGEREFPTENDWRKEEELLMSLAVSGAVGETEMSWRKWDECDHFTDWSKKT